MVSILEAILIRHIEKYELELAYSAITCPKLTIETLEQKVKYVQS